MSVVRTCTTRGASRDSTYFHRKLFFSSFHVISCTQIQNSKIFPHAFPNFACCCCRDAPVRHCLFGKGVSRCLKEMRNSTRLSPIYSPGSLHPEDCALWNETVFGPRIRRVTTDQIQFCRWGSSWCSPVPSRLRRGIVSSHFSPRRHLRFLTLSLGDCSKDFAG